ncbi:MAG: adenosylcobinamide amidohydrolase [Deltaproteobacteria bacterium]|jgi:adenosylcobinamide amidohydrolase|nr:adenosylcobinamide amidohydrolase [Deltaproteobacteria bacterium]
MLLGRYYDAMELHREDKIVFARFLSPHTVLSTSRAGGGYREDVTVLFNHQSCEPGGHGHGKASKGYTDPEGYMADICAEHGLPASESASLSTAANMHLVAVKERSFKELTVIAAVTGGVEGNAGRAGDPAVGYEGPEGYESVSPDSGSVPKPGTINTLLFINKPLNPGALVRTVMMATEAKTAALQELNVNSRYSDGLATGTGTDQIGVAAKKEPGYPELTNAGKHSKLGELIGLTVKEATKAVLVRQNGMSPDRQCSAKILLERFFKRDSFHWGIRGVDLAELFSKGLDDPEDARLFQDNRLPLFHDPVNAAAVMALVHLRDQFAWGVLPPLVWPEVMAAHAAQLVAAISGKYHRLPEYREMFRPNPDDRSNEAFIRMVGKAFAIGFKEKW